jgi:PIN domain nuclease of toxin-antitoxin system
MNLLLDTHVLLWWLADDELLPIKIRTLIKKPTNTVFVSAISAWEISIKKALGKLKAPDNIELAVKASEFQPLPIQIHHAEAAGALPRHHDDPFDRMLIAQANIEKLTLITHDKQIGKYKTKLILI